MYVTTVLKRKRMSEEESKKILYPILIWMFSSVVCLYILTRYRFPIPFLLGILIIIPITIRVIKITSDYRGKNAYYTEEIEFNIIDGELYVGDKRIEDSIDYDVRAREIYIEDMTIEEPYIDDFVKYLKDNSFIINEVY